MISSRSWLFGSARLLCSAAIIATAGNAAAGERAEDAANPNPSVTVDLSVIDEQGDGPALRSLARPGGPLMPRPGVFPQSELHEPAPSHSPYATPPRQRPVNLSPPGSKRTAPPIRPLALADPMPTPRPKETPAADPRGDIASARPPEAVAATETASEASTETASTSPLSPERPERAQPAGLPPPAAPALAVNTERATATPVDEEQTVSLQPASRGEQAALPSGDDGQGMRPLLRVPFEASETALTGPSRGELKELAGRLRGRENMRLELLAYAEGEGLSPSKARRVSLSRALSVRSYLVENGIETSRIDVRALGNKAPSAPLDRVDVKVVQR